METVEEAEPVEPHPFLALVLARMKTNPGEFGPDSSPWRALIETSKQYLTAEEKKALKAAERCVGLDHLHKKMMGKLLADKPPPAKPSAAAISYTSDSGMNPLRTLGSYTGQSYDDMFKQILERLDAIEP